MKTSPLCLRFGLAGPIQLAFLIALQSAFAGSATWNLNPTSSDWNTAANWTPATVPNDIATFGFSTITDVQASAEVRVNSIVFNPGASSYPISASPDFAFTISGTGIVNNSGLPQNFVSIHKPTFGALQFVGSASAGTNTFFTVLASENGGSYGGEVDFYDTSNAGEATFTNRGDGPYGGYTQFFEEASAAQATLINNGTEPGDTLGGQTVFYDSSTSGNATVINNGGISPGLGGGGTTWFNTSTAGDATVISEGGTGPNTLGGLSRFAGGSPGNATLIAMGGTDGGDGGEISFAGPSISSSARVELFGNGFMDLPGDQFSFELGSIEGNGNIFLSDSDLFVGNNNVSAVFSGVISDGGSFIKVGEGTLTLRGANTYRGGTTIDGGTLKIQSTVGSGTGTGAVDVLSGSLAGSGVITGAVTIGTGSGAGAFLTPGMGANKAATLTIQGALTFKADDTYSCRLNTRKRKADQVIANGVTIENGAQVAFKVPGNEQLRTGKTAVVIRNTAATPISGTFANGSIFSVGPNTFHVSYQGGDGNDLTLRVVP